MTGDKARLAPVPGTALHRQIYLALRDRIFQGAYPQGAALPSEEQLVREFGVGRVTVRRALADLQDKGLVLRRQGVGTFVRGGLAPHTVIPSLGWVDELAHTARTTRVKVLQVEHKVPPAWIAAALQLADGEEAVYAERLRSARGVPLMFHETWVLRALGRALTASAMRHKPQFEILAEEGVQFGRVLQQISAAIAGPEKARHLNCEVGAPLIRLTRLLHDRAGVPVRHLTSYMNPMHSSILMDIPGSAIDTLSGGHVVHETDRAGAGQRREKKTRK